MLFEFNSGDIALGALRGAGRRAWASSAGPCDRAVQDSRGGTWLGDRDPYSCTYRIKQSLLSLPLESFMPSLLILCLILGLLSPAPSSLRIALLRGTVLCELGEEDGLYIMVCSPANPVDDETHSQVSSRLQDRSEAT